MNDQITIIHERDRKILELRKQPENLEGSMSLANCPETGQKLHEEKSAQFQR